MKDFEPKFRVVSELQRLAERAFIFKLRKKRPDISESEISTALAEWYLTREELGPEDFMRRRIDLSNFTPEGR